MVLCPTYKLRENRGGRRERKKKKGLQMEYVYNPSRYNENKKQLRDIHKKIGYFCCCDL